MIGIAFYAWIQHLNVDNALISNAALKERRIERDGFNT
jgi:hypothetical protein